MTLHEKVVWRVIGNRDLTEGRGPRYTKALCELEATARRVGKKGYVQGGDCPIEQTKLVRIEKDGRLGSWLGPVDVMQPTADDKKLQARLDEVTEQKRAKEAAIEKAKELGLSDEELEALRQ